LFVSWLLFFVFLYVGLTKAANEEETYHRTRQNTLRSVALSFATATEMAGHSKITKETKMSDPLYTNIRDLHAAWCKDVPFVAYIYTLRLREKSFNKLDFIVSCPSDVNDDHQIQGKLEEGEALFQPYDEWFEVFQKGFDGKTEIDENLYSPEYGGNFIVVTTPLRDPNNRRYIEAILCVDFHREQWDELYRRVQFASAQFLALILSLYLASLYFISITQSAFRKVSKTNGELTAAKKTADTVAKAKSDFLANMSHEIRTPMNALLGFSEILTQRVYQNSLPQEQEESEGILEIIRKSGEDLLKIIDNILDFSKIEANLLQVESVPFSPRQVIEDVWKSKMELVVEKHLDFSVKYKEPVPEKILGDPVHLKQILNNIIDNAVKFTESGTITVCCAVTVDHGTEHSPDAKNPYLDAATLRIDVIDTGVGISAKQIKHLFEPFTPDGESSPRQYSGTGLGLSVAQRLAQLMDGSITVSSTPGSGSTFTLTLHAYLPSEEKLPESVLRRAAKGELKKDSRIEPGLEVRAPEQPYPSGSGHPAAANTDRQPLKNIRVLLVEDMVVNQLVITAQLTSAGAKVEVAGNGEQAISRINQDTDNGLFFDVVLMDMQMPVMDGYEAAQKLRQQGYSRPIIAVTAHALSGDREKTITAGCDDYITKPVDRNLLINMIMKHL
jgi:signal transduction histidine kinase/ActR/RegA family two-component response regulator